MAYENHPTSSLFPLMGKSKLDELAANIKENGLLESIELYEGLVLDGRNRLAACKLAAAAHRHTPPRCRADHGWFGAEAEAIQAAIDKAEGGAE